jgi:hypothetical protein
VVDRVLPVGLRGEDRAEQQPVAAKLNGVVKPRGEMRQPVPDRLVPGQRGPLRAGETERVHVPQNGVIGPRHEPQATRSPGAPPGFTRRARLRTRIQNDSMLRA